MGLGAVSTAEWTGVPLVEVLDRAGVKSSAREVVFRGADHGTLPGKTEAISFERSLTLDDARDSEVLLAYAMNGEPLPIQHGYPMRVIVPSWYAVASVKWLTDIEAVDGPYRGQYQTGSYFYDSGGDGALARDPVRLQRVRALITEPKPDDVIDAGELAIRGVAWSGAAAIERVDVCVGDGDWQDARLVAQRYRHSWQWWELLTRVGEPGPMTIRARATDLAGRKQPSEPESNRLGYGNNAVHKVAVRVV
jgi:DMSO/TMAO reductase YedYZ molybdopterin-dependent catalytic subunit